MIKVGTGVSVLDKEFEELSSIEIFGAEKSKIPEIKSSGTVGKNYSLSSKRSAGHQEGNSLSIQERIRKLRNKVRSIEKSEVRPGQCLYHDFKNFQHGITFFIEEGRLVKKTVFCRRVQRGDRKGREYSVRHEGRNIPWSEYVEVMKGNDLIIGSENILEALDTYRAIKGQGRKRQSRSFRASRKRL